jgi:hypothetical protein
MRREENHELTLMLISRDGMAVPPETAATAAAECRLRHFAVKANTK